MRADHGMADELGIMDRLAGKSVGWLGCRQAPQRKCWLRAGDLVPSGCSVEQMDGRAYPIPKIKDTPKMAISRISNTSAA